MSDVGALLELLYTARDRWRTVRVTVSDWTHLERSHLAYERYLERTQGIQGPSIAVGTYGEGAGRHPRELSFVSRIWLEGQGRFREEREGQDLTLAFDGERAVIYSPDSGVIEHESVRPTADSLFDPALLIPALALAERGESTVAGRRTLVVEATPRLPGLPPTDLVPYGCDGVTLQLDAERGVVLRLEARLDGEPVHVLEVTEIAFDEELPDAVFRFELPAGETVRTAAEAYPYANVTLEQAARAAAFTVWAPARLPGRWHTHVIHRPATERPTLAETVTMLFSDSESLHHFGIEQAAERLLAWRVGGEEVVERDGVELRLIGGDKLPGPPLEVHLERDGTHIRVYSNNLDQAALIDVASSLAPAPTELPPTSE
jgi:outer membrane lipoprotein-sorting protein